MIKFLLAGFIFLLFISCGRKCVVCRVINNGAIIEIYESCDNEEKETCKSICEEMAKLQNSKCECKEITEREMTEKSNTAPKKTLLEAKSYINEFFTENNESIYISNELIDSEGANMAIITDEALKLGYSPNGFIDKEIYRIYKYKKN